MDTPLERLEQWVTEVAELTKPDQIRWCTGDSDEYAELVDMLVEQGTVVRLNEERKPNSIYLRTDPGDVARVEESTYICSETEAGPLNNWIHPRDMKATMWPLFDGCMKGRTMYVAPFSMGSLDATHPIFGVELTDSPYVVLSLHIMTRMGTAVLDEITRRDERFTRCLHSVGMPLDEDDEDVAWPCNETKYISHFTDENAVWSFGSGYGGNSLLNKKCLALRIASVLARDEGWLAEHMLLLKLTSPEGKSYYICAAFPSACGKTNLAMLQPTVPGWKAETLGDDVAWLRFGPDGRLYAINPENGFFGVAPGTGHKTNPNAMATIEKGNSIFTNVALTDDGDVWWEGLTKQAPEHLIDWRGRDWTAEDGPVGGRPSEPAAHPNSRFTTPISQCPILAEEYELPDGVPVDIIIFGGRRQNTIPLVNQSFSWEHGVFLGATMSSETTPAAKGAVGVVRRDPMAMRPFIGYHVTDYLDHWIDMGRKHDPEKMPKIFYVNWFRKDADGNFLWPGFGENSRVLKWMIDRIEGRVEAIETPIGWLPDPADIDTEGLDLAPEVVAEVARFAANEWNDEYPRLVEWLESMGRRLPEELKEELNRLGTALGA